MIKLNTPSNVSSLIKLLPVIASIKDNCNQMFDDCVEIYQLLFENL